MKKSHSGYIFAKNNRRHVIIIGSGVAGLTAACLLAKDGFQVTVLERNWLPGGCASSYPRKGYIFESGATTLVGLSDNMPLDALMRATGIQIPRTQLPVPMKVHLTDGQILTRHEDINAWIIEAKRVFGENNQRAFWEYCYKISQFVWETSVKQKAFPPSNWKDIWQMTKAFRPKQLRFAPLAFQSMKQLLQRFDLYDHQVFRSFVNEQLLITAQNYLEEVNVLFGATALCYTNYPNYYVPGGLIEMINPMVDYIKSRGGEVLLKVPVTNISKEGGKYIVDTKFRKIEKSYIADKVISSIPINNTLDLCESIDLSAKYQDRILHSKQLNSAFQMGIVFKRRHKFNCLHHQIHLANPLPYMHSHSIFLSLSHPDDAKRCKTDEVIASISTHVPDPINCFIEDQQKLERIVIEELISRGFFLKEDLIYHHSSTPKSWQKWTGRRWGFVGGYPQYLRIKPWQMIDARLDHKGAYICGDSTYPGQGIPGACLSGMIAYEKLCRDM